MPCDVHTNCANDGCHLLFIQCEACAEKMEHCCSTECLEITHLPLAEQVALRAGKQVGNKIFRKGKSEALKYKHSGQLEGISLAKATDFNDGNTVLNRKRKHFANVLLRKSISW